ncbi:PilN domain-containing protein [Desulforhabdus amnigena]|uniref:Fimbrial assembly protein n=1 Tax=Desulforhabdus amnigena TaxID=40218 RepID=A0A9W6CZR7_9BACT|nr:PilN domain-containing protein [Desulforhabdus amnigena]NLJ26808.1 PilN domain-containing protein [Deltaproteobacteria bacterium]GLI34771.1 hypothetical protein DAMNIGENAA_22040 [Desulforhabdus amnigena]
MLKGSIKHRTRELVAVYVEPRRVEVLRAHRQWRSWLIDSTETFTVPQDENLYEYLQRLNLRPKARKGAALLLFLPHTYYNFHREHYPSTLKDQLEDALNFDWQENIFYELDRTIHFAAPSIPVDHLLSVPIFSLQRDLYEKFSQAIGGEAFENFAVMPSALVYGSILPPAPENEEALPLRIVGRILDPHHMEIHRFYEGIFLDSAVIARQMYNLRLFRENLQCIEAGTDNANIPIQIICAEGENDEACKLEWERENLNIEVHSLQHPFVVNWVKHLLTQDVVKTFDTQLLLKPWEVPKVAWPVLALVALFSIYAAFQVYAYNKLQQDSLRLKRQILQLEAQWKPIEELQTRVSKFEEDQKTLSEFNAEGYPLFELLTLLSNATPDDTWLNYFSLRKGQMMLRGESKSAIKYLSDLSKIEGFQDVRFASPVTRNPASDEERFNLNLQVDLEKLRKTIADLQIEMEEDKALEEGPADAALAGPMEADEAPGQEVPLDSEEAPAVPKGN